MKVEHRREDGELLGWIDIHEDGSCTAIDLLGRVSAAGDWDKCENQLEAQGLSYLADLYALEVTPGLWVRVRIVEVNSTRVRVKEDDFGDATISTPIHDVPIPVDNRLVPYALAPGEVHSTSKPRSS